jgi:hypothetical protein
LARLLAEPEAPPSFLAPNRLAVSGSRSLYFIYTSLAILAAASILRSSA